MFRCWGVCLTRLPLIRQFLQNNVVKEFSLKQRLQVNKHLKSRKSNSSEGSCSVWEAADSLHTHTVSLQTQSDCRKMLCHWYVLGHNETWECHNPSWIHLGKFVQFCPHKLGRLQVEKSYVAAWSPQSTYFIHVSLGYTPLT